jgi:hypothetical protein
MDNLRCARTYQVDGTRDYLRANCMTYGNGVLIVLSTRESRVHGEGAQTMFIPGNREEHVICDRLKLSSVCFRNEANKGCRSTICIDNSFSTSPDLVEPLAAEIALRARRLVPTSRRKPHTFHSAVRNCSSSCGQ